ncbi:MAG: Flp family type IVb pilin [Thermoanaerobaculia bacterium]
MQNLKNLMHSFWRDESGQDLAEYALLIVLIVVVTAAAIRALGPPIKAAFESATGELEGGG